MPASVFLHSTTFRNRRLHTIPVLVRMNRGTHRCDEYDMQHIPLREKGKHINPF
jgi:hypothetical protein